MSAAPLYNSSRQTTDRAPTEWETALGDVIETGFAAGAWELDKLVAHLNASRVRLPDGSAWTVDKFTALMRELGG